MLISDQYDWQGGRGGEGERGSVCVCACAYVREREISYFFTEDSRLNHAIHSALTIQSWNK